MRIFFDGNSFPRFPSNINVFLVHGTRKRREREKKTTKELVSRSKQLVGIQAEVWIAKLVTRCLYIYIYMYIFRWNNIYGIIASFIRLTVNRCGIGIDCRLKSAIRLIGLKNFLVTSIRSDSSLYIYIKVKSYSL